VSQDASETREGPFTPNSASVFDEYRERIRRYIVGLMRDFGEADDLPQETFLRAHRNLESLQDAGTLSVWLYRIATNICYGRVRQASYRRAVSDMPPA